MSMFDPDAPAAIPTVANGYIALPVTVSYAALYNAAFQFIAAQFPGWLPADGNLATTLVEVMALMVSTQAAVAAQMPLQAFAYYGGSLLNIPPLVGSAAETTTTWTMVDDQGYTVPGGTIVAFATTGNTTTLFSTTADFTVPPGSTATASGAVTVAATVVGAAANGIGTGTPLTLVDALPYVVGIVSTAITSGGADPESQSQYLSRLSNQLQLLSPRPVLAADFATLAVNLPYVDRAVGIDNCNPYNNLLSAVGASFETGTGTWVAGTNTTIAQSSAWAADGTHSLSMTATGSGSITATNMFFAATAGQQFSAMTLFHAAATGETCSVGLQWYDIDHNLLSTTTGTPISDSTAGGTQATVAGTAPAGTARVGMIVTVTGCAASEVHYIDEAALFLGASITTWQAGGLTTGQERCVTVIPVDVDGNALTVSDMGALQTYLSDLRETNFVVSVIPPEYTAVTVVAAIVAQPSADLNTVQAAATAALTAYLSPATWAGGANTPAQWLNDNTIYYANVAGVLAAVPGFHHLVAGSLTINGGTTDLTLSGIVSLPVPNISVTVTAAASNT